MNPFRGLFIQYRAALARLAATVAVLTALAALAGHAFGLPLLYRWLPGSAAMAASTALGQTLTGLALLMLANPAPARLRRLALAFATLAATIGVGMLNFEHTRTAPLTALALIAAGVALFALTRPHWHTAIAPAALVVLGIGASSITWRLLRHWSPALTPRLSTVSLPNAVSCVLLGLAILGVRRAGNALDEGAGATVEAKMLGGFLLAVGLLLFSGAYTYRSSLEFSEAMQWVAHTQAVRSALDGLSRSLTEAELAQRDASLTGDSAQRARGEALAMATAPRLANIARLTADDATVQDEIAALRPQLTAYVRDLGAAPTVGGDTATTARVRSQTQRRDAELRGVLAAIDRLSARESRLLAQREAASIVVQYSMLVSLLITLTIASAIFWLLFRGVRRETLARSRSTAALRASDRFNRSIIDSSPDCMIVLDRDARIERITLQGCRLLEVDDSEQLVGGDWLGFWSGADRSAARRAIDAAVAGEPGRFQGEYPTFAGVHKWWDVIVMPVHGADGRVERLIATARDISESKRTEQSIRRLNIALQQQAEDLRATNQELESFSYSVSHDLRAPLRAISGFALMIEEESGRGLDGEGRRRLEVIRTNSARMGALIDDLLAFSRMGRQPLVKMDIDMNALVREVFDAAAGEARTPAPEVLIGPLPPVRADRALMRQVWDNLVSNALKYGAQAAAPRIEVRGARDGAEIVYSIRDNGVGFSMEYYEQLFRVFQRLHRVDEFGGTGVGLAIVNRIVSRHGGRVWADAEVGVGAEFFFSIPCGDGHG